jgi:ABC-type transporter Mla subunit MlaD
MRGLAAAALLAALMLVPASTSLAMDSAAADIQPPETDQLMAQATLSELRALVDDLNIANDELRANNSTLQQSVDTLALERDRLSDSLSHFDQLYEPIEADRQLLFELRKGLPETRPEAEAQLSRIRSLALSSNPARLGQLLDRVDDAAPAFLDWRFTQFTSSQEATEAYINSGANAFDSSMDEFRSEVLMSVANRLDGLLNVIDRVR